MMEPIVVEVEAFWQEFIRLNKLNTSLRYKEAYHFCMDEKWANILLKLVMEGQKKATTSSYISFEKLQIPLPVKGDYNILIDWDGHPHCVIQNTQVTHLLFKDMTYEICRREGEDDSLQSWREGHIRYFKDEAKALNYSFNEDLMIIFEDFEVVYQKDI